MTYEGVTFNVPAVLRAGFAGFAAAHRGVLWQDRPEHVRESMLRSVWGLALRHARAGCA